MTLLLDSLALLYRSYYAIPNLTTPEGKPTGALYGFLQTTTHLLETLKPDTVIACFDRPEPTVRSEMYSAYKGTREVPEDDLIEQINGAKELLPSLGVVVLEKAGYEADDIIGSLVKKLKDDIVIITCDNDLLQLVDDTRVSVHLLVRGTKEFAVMGAQAVEQKYGFPPHHLPDYKGLAGDASDNIPGVFGIGAVTAKKLISTIGNLDAIYDAVDSGNLEKQGFKKRVVGLLEEHKESALQSRELATIHVDLPLPLERQISGKWQERVSWKDAQERLQAYALTSTIKRYQKLLGIEEMVVEDGNEASPALTLETAIALWVLDADKVNVGVKEILSYTDTKTVAQANAKILAELQKTNRFSVWEDIEKPLIPILQKMEEVGVHMDKKALVPLKKMLEKKLLAIEKNIHTIAGKEFNINSPKQLGVILFEELSLQSGRKVKTSTGQRSTKESVLLDMYDEHPVIPLILQYRHLKKLLSSYIAVFIKLIDANNRLHTNFIQSGTTTGRLASREPNMQNIPTATPEGQEIKHLFTATPGWQLLTADYSQFELRISAILSGEENLLTSFKQGEDIHTSVAAHIFHISQSEVTTEQRRQAKVVNFGILYGMGAVALRRALGSVSQQEAKQFLEEYRLTFPQLTTYLESLKKEARENGCVQTVFGRSRPIHGATSSLSFVRAQAERMAMNAPIQGTAADIIKQAMIAIDKEISENKKLKGNVRMLLQIHDELFFEVKSEVLDESISLITQKMESVYPKDKKPIPLLVDVKVGCVWGLLEHVKKVG